MDRRIVTLISALALFGVIVAVVLIAGNGKDDKKATTTASTGPECTTASNPDQYGPLDKKPTITASDAPAPTELECEDIVVGDGAVAKKGDNVSMQYVGAIDDTGKEFDASWDRGEPYTFDLGTGNVIEGWDQGIVGMKVGGRRKLVIPADLGYGAAGSPPTIPPNSTLVFIVDLAKIN